MNMQFFLSFHSLTSLNMNYNRGKIATHWKLLMDIGTVGDLSVCFVYERVDILYDRIATQYNYIFARQKHLEPSDLGHIFYKHGHQTVEQLKLSLTEFCAKYKVNCVLAFDNTMEFITQTLPDKQCIALYKFNNEWFTMIPMEIGVKITYPNQVLADYNNKIDTNMLYKDWFANFTIFKDSFITRPDLLANYDKDISKLIGKRNELANMWSAMEAKHIFANRAVLMKPKEHQKSWLRQKIWRQYLFATNTNKTQPADIQRMLEHISNHNKHTQATVAPILQKLSVNVFIGTSTGITDLTPDKTCNKCIAFYQDAETLHWFDMFPTNDFNLYAHILDGNNATKYWRWLIKVLERPEASTSNAPVLMTNEKIARRKTLLGTNQPRNKHGSTAHHNYITALINQMSPERRRLVKMALDFDPYILNNLPRKTNVASAMNHIRIALSLTHPKLANDIKYLEYAKRKSKTSNSKKNIRKLTHWRKTIGRWPRKLWRRRLGRLIQKRKMKRRQT